MRISRFLFPVCLAVLASCSKPAPPPPAPSSAQQTFKVPEKGAYNGGYLDFGDHEDDVTLEGIESFEEETGRSLAIIASSSYWGEQRFPRRNMDIISRHGSIPLVFWSPWDRPYQQDHPPDQFSLQSILDGKWDAYIDQWADAAKAFGHPMLVAWGIEMNGTWFPWSGYRNGADQPLGNGLFAGPETYKKAYRYVVDRVRARGAKNILWVFHVNNQNAPPDPWNTMAAYYPGDGYVDWLGLSAYGAQFPTDPWFTVESTFQQGYNELAAISPNKPIMLAEWGIGEFPGIGPKDKWIVDAVEYMKARMPRLKAAVVWNERWENADGSFSNLRVTSSPKSLEAFRQISSDPYWVDRAILE